MEGRKAERLKAYLKLIASRQEPDRVIEAAVAPTHGLGLESMEDPRAGAARQGMEALLSGHEPSLDQLSGMEALILPKLRPAVDIVDGKFTVTHHLWLHLSNDAAIRQRIEDAIPSIGRIELPGNRRYPYGGTGFLVGDRLVMTNRHVAAIFADGLGDRRITFKPDHRAGIDFLQERGGRRGQIFLVRRVVMIHPYWDMAIVAVDGIPPGTKTLKLSLADIAEVPDGYEIAVVGYPAFDPRNDAAEQDEVFDKAYGVKRLQPGQLHRRAGTESFGKIVSAAAHDCSTLGGNSGSAVIDLTNGEVLALHFGGRYQEMNYGVPAAELALDGRVVDAGVHFAGRASGGTPSWADWWSRTESVGTDAEPDDGIVAPQPPPTAAGTSPANLQAPAATGGATTIEIPLQITIRLGTASVGGDIAEVSAKEAVAAGGNITEALAEPFHETDYRTRKGYDETFLGQNVPIPEASDPSVLAKTRDGTTTLYYQNFSIKMHAARRLALVTAANITANPKLKKPEEGRNYTRRGLSGLGKNDQERWIIDPRLDEAFQLPDVFFTKDRKAFDKGHIVRREDVAWGSTYDELRRANGDTYHVPNCSPQTAEFNRSGSGKDNWGDLEDHVLSVAAKERLVVFAGPVLDPADTVFVGTGGSGRQLRAKIPSRFWKVIVAAAQDGIAAFGFLLEQDLSDVAFEYVVAEEFLPKMAPLAEIAELTGVRFPEVVVDADQFDTVRGAEVAMRAGIRRKTRKSA